MPEPIESELLERGDLLGQLGQLAAQAHDGAGSVALVTGEAGVGKSSLVNRFLGQLDRFGIARGACDALYTPRPLGPLHDIARELRGELLRVLIEQVPRPQIFAKLLDALEAEPVALLIEDVHWADEATLDLLKFLGRRIARTRALLLVTYRDDTIGPEHPLRSVIADLPAAVCHRLPVPPLSRDAVAWLARLAGRSEERIYERTGGNPFYVTELLATPDAVPASVRDAVFARAQKLTAAGRKALETASIVPGRVESWLLAELLGQRLEPVDECVSAGMLQSLDGAFAFRHELAREAIASGLSAARARELHRSALSALIARARGSLAQLVHHAAAADVAEDVLRYAPQAAREAAQLGAHHQAVAHYRTALRYADALDARSRATLLEHCAYECYLTGEFTDAVECREAVLAIARELDDARLEGETLRWLSRLGWFGGDRARAERYGDTAIEVLEGVGTRDEALAWAYSNRSQLCMLAGDTDGARAFGQRALDLAGQLGSDEIRCHALNNIGTSLYSRLHDPAGLSLLEESLAIALTHEYDEHAARAYTNLSSMTCWRRNYTASAGYLDAGIAYCIERDLDTWRDYMLGWRAKLRFDRGDWEGARSDAEPIAGNERSATMMRLPSIVMLTRLAVRAGTPGAADALRSALDLAAPTGESQRVLPLAAAAAELAWCENDADGIIRAVLDALPVARKDPAPWETGELLYWLDTAGAKQPTGLEIAPPWAASLRGDWSAAAEAFEKLGCHFEHALALMRGDAEARRQALVLFETIGATPAATRLRRELRIAGERNLPRGPRATTRSHPAGLTRRQSDVLALLTDGLTDAQIAAKLHLSTKTVGHHVSAILAKLGVTSRREAAAWARRNGVVQ